MSEVPVVRATLSSRVRVSTCDEDAALGADVALDAVCRLSDVVINADQQMSHSVQYANPLMS